MRSLLWLAVALVLVLPACRAPSLDVDADPPIRIAPALQDLYSGEWHGTSFREGDAVGTPWTLVQTVSIDGTPVGRLTFVGTTIPPANVKLVQANDSSFVSLIGPYYSPTLSGDVVTRVEGNISADRMWGTFYARPVSGGDAMKGRFDAVKVTRKPT